MPKTTIGLPGILLAKNILSKGLQKDNTTVDELQESSGFIQWP